MKIPMTEVLAWLQEHHPALHRDAAIERDWVWLCTDLRGDHNKPARESIKEQGFRFAKRGHALPDGKIAYWAHACQRPIAFKRKGKAGAEASNKSGRGHQAQRPDPLAASQDDVSLDELAAAFA